MNDATATRLAIARTAATRLAANSNIRTIFLTGSVARGYADDNSDIDTILLLDAPVSDEEYAAICAEAEATGGGSFGGTPAEGFGVYHYIEGIKCDFGYDLVSGTERDLGALLATPSTDVIMHTVASGLLDALPLYGAAWIEAWQARLAHFPPDLAETMVRAHLHFQPRWVLEQMGVARGEVLLVYELLLTTVQNIMWVLCGLNRLYYPGKLKGIGWKIDKMTFAPPRLRERCEQLLQADASATVQLWSDLVEDTLALVETHMPQIDTTRAREVLEMRLRQSH